METGGSYSVLTANLIGVMLIITLWLSNTHRMRDDRDMRTVSFMMLVILIGNIADTLIFFMDGRPGAGSAALIYFSGSCLFLGNVCVGYCWVKFLTDHLNIPFSKARKIIYCGLICAACLLLAANLFYPLVFTAPGNVYKRGSLYWVFLAIAFFYIGDGMFLYIRSRSRNGVLKIFPVQVFLFPVFTGVVVQALVYEMSITWTSIAVAAAGIITALKNESIFSDRLTGLNNRTFMEVLFQRISKQKDTIVSGVMIDLNGFKKINDCYGHSSGDEALRISAGVLNGAFAECGVVVRYAGDEFVALLNTTDEALVQRLIDRAHRGFAEVSDSGKIPYRLSAAMGYAVMDFGKLSMDEFIRRIDGEMYRKKLEYYQE